MRKVVASVIAAVGMQISLAGGAAAVEMTPAVAELYKSVSIPPPTSSQMIVCYGYVCRRRYILEFTTQDRAALTRIMSAGKASAVAERAAVQEAVIWWDKRLGPILGTNKREARADFRLSKDRTPEMRHDFLHQ